MPMTEEAQAYCRKIFSNQTSDLTETDPEFAARFASFTFDEVARQVDLAETERYMAILAALMGVQGVDEYRIMLPAALNGGVTAVAVKEIVYQATAYLGMGRVRPFLQATNETLTARGIALPLAGQATTTMASRREAGNQVQVEIFGEQMRQFWESGPEESRRINIWLADNCFGDYYTRTGLSIKERELVTFCFLAALGGCEPQLTSHAAANMRIGNDKAYLIKVISQCLPYIGYPRSLNALQCVNAAAEK